MKANILLFALAVLPSISAAERIRLGDGRFDIEISAPLTDWIKERGPRFDTTAAVVSVRINETEFLADGGLADEFNPKWISPPGFDQAQPGDPFLKIGVGVLLRLSDWRYFFGHHYVVERLADVERLPATDDRSIGFRQRCDSGLGWAYDYEKTYSINTTRCELAIRYRIKNTGDKAFTIEAYNHNWFAFASSADDAASHDLKTPLKLDAGAFSQGPASEPIYRMLEQAAPATSNHVTLRHATDGRRVDIKGDFAVSRFALFVDARSFCPEIFCRWTLASGEEATWTRSYRFGIEPRNQP